MTSQLQKSCPQQNRPFEPFCHSPPEPYSVGVCARGWSEAADGGCQTDSKSSIFLRAGLLQLALIHWLYCLLLPFALLAVPAPQFREPQAPFVSGDGFRSYADYVYDELDVTLDPKSVKPSGVIFVRSSLLREFFEQVHPSIPNKYILISHNSDDNVPGPYASYLDDPKLIAWFTINYDGTKHPKIHPIPIGIANLCLPNGNTKTITKVRELKLPKEHLAYMNLTIQTCYPERWPVFQQFAKEPFCYRTMKKVFEGYLKEVASSQFIIAPRGVGFDTYRLWEALYIGTIPIVKSSPLDSLYAELPILIVKDWKLVTEEFLQKKQLEMSQAQHSLEKLDMAYWIKQIESYK